MESNSLKLRVEWATCHEEDEWYVSEERSTDFGKKTLFGPMPKDVVNDFIIERKKFYRELSKERQQN